MSTKATGLEAGNPLAANGPGAWQDEIRAQLLESAAVQRRTAQFCGEPIMAAAALISDSIARGGKLILCGNGGSAADAQHLSAELVGRMNDCNRPALPALALTADTSALTALGNDFGFASIFARQVEALARSGDVLMAISTSGRSENVLAAVTAAARLGLGTVGLTGADGGPLAEAVDIDIRVPSGNTQRIQEAHIAIGHVICHLVEQRLGGGGERKIECLTGLTNG